MKIYTQFNPPPKVSSPAGGKSLTDQSAVKDTDINTILKRHNIGDNSAVKSLGIYADVTQIQNFAENVEFIRKAKEDFLALPSTIRDRFGNDPVALVKFLQDKDNDKEAVRLGLKEYRKPEKTFADEVADAITRSQSKKETTSV